MLAKMDFFALRTAMNPQENAQPERMESAGILEQIDGLASVPGVPDIHVQNPQGFTGAF
jgi:hypothetical protein